MTTVPKRAGRWYVKGWVLPGSQGPDPLLEQAQKAGQDVGTGQAPRLLLLA